MEWTNAPKKKHEYDERFEKIWKEVMPKFDDSKKQSGYKVFKAMIGMTCPYCGCTEMLCGHNGVGCDKEG